jgi:hypothetical protein
VSLATFWDWFAWTMIAVDVVCAVVMGRRLVSDLRDSRAEMRARHASYRRELDERSEALRRVHLLLKVHSTVRVRRFDAEGRPVGDDHLDGDVA